MINKIIVERERQKGLPFDTEAFDKQNTRNDWISYITSYAGRAAVTERNEREEQDFEKNLIKVGALVLAALEAHEKGYC